MTYEHPSCIKHLRQLCVEIFSSLNDNQNDKSRYAFTTLTHTLLHISSMIYRNKEKGKSERGEKGLTEANGITAINSHECMRMVARTVGKFAVQTVKLYQKFKF